MVTSNSFFSRGCALFVCLVIITNFCFGMHRKGDSGDDFIKAIKNSTDADNGKLLKRLNGSRKNQKRFFEEFNRIVKAQVRGLKDEVEELMAEIARLRELNETLSGEKNNWEEECVFLHRELEGATKKIEALNDVISGLENEKRVLLRAAEEFERSRHDISHRDNFEEFQEKINKLTELNRTLIADNEKMLGERNSWEFEKKDFTKNLEKMDQTVLDLGERNRELGEEVKKLLVQVATSKKKEELWGIESAQLKRDIRELEKLNQELNIEKERLVSANGDLGKSLKGALLELETLKKEFEKVSAENERVTLSYHEFGELHKSLSDKNKQLLRNNASLGLSIKEKDAQILRLREEKDSALEKVSAILQYISKQCKTAPQQIVSEYFKRYVEPRLEAKKKPVRKKKRVRRKRKKVSRKGVKK